MPHIFRTEKAQCLWGLESAYGVKATPVNRFGLHEQVQVPDPDYGFVPFFGVGSSSRSRNTILRGPLTLRGSVPDIRLQKCGALGPVLALPLGNFTGGVVGEGQSALDERLSSITMSVIMHSTDGVTKFIREYMGGKVNRATYAAQEGGALTLSLDEIIFQDIQHNRSGVAKYNAGANGGTDPGACAGGLFYFAGAKLTFFGTEICRVKRFALTVDNRLEPKYYLCREGDPVEMSQVLTDLVEGRRSYQLQVELDVADPTSDLKLFEFMLNQGAAGATGLTEGGVITADFAVAPGEGSGVLSIVCSFGADDVFPASVVTGGKVNIPPPPGGLFPGSYTIDVDRVFITVPA